MRKVCVFLFFPLLSPDHTVKSLCFILKKNKKARPCANKKRGNGRGRGTREKRSVEDATI